MDEREAPSAPSPAPEGAAGPGGGTGDPGQPDSGKKDVSGVVGWVLLIALAIGVLALRFFGGGC